MCAEKGLVIFSGVVVACVRPLLSAKLWACGKQVLFLLSLLVTSVQRNVLPACPVLTIKSDRVTGQSREVSL